MGDERIWERIDELKGMLAKVLAVLDEREKNCSRHDACINSLKERVRKLEIDQGKWSMLAAIGSAMLTAAAVKVFVG